MKVWSKMDIIVKFSQDLGNDFFEDLSTAFFRNYNADT